MELLILCPQVQLHLLMIYHHHQNHHHTSFTNSKLKYSTISTTAYGGINQLSLTDTGGGYLSIPGITTITSNR